MIKYTNKAMNNIKSFDSFLPDNNTLKSREEKWLNVFAKYEAFKNDEYMSDDNDEECDDDEECNDDDEESDVHNDHVLKQLVKVDVTDDENENKAEDSDASFVEENKEEDFYDIQEIASKATVAIQNRVSNWKRIGFKLAFKSHLHDMNIGYWLQTLSNNGSSIFLTQNNTTVFRTMTISEYAVGNSFSAAIFPPIAPSPGNYMDYQYAPAIPLSYTPRSLPYTHIPQHSFCCNWPQNVHKTPQIQGMPYTPSDLYTPLINKRAAIARSCETKKRIRRRPFKASLRYRQSANLANNSSDDSDNETTRKRAPPRVYKESINLQKKQQTSSRAVPPSINETFVIERASTKTMPVANDQDEHLFKKPIILPVKTNKPQNKIEDIPILKPDNPIKVPTKIEDIPILKPDNPIKVPTKIEDIPILKPDNPIKVPTKIEDIPILKPNNSIKVPTEEPTQNNGIAHKKTVEPEPNARQNQSNQSDEKTDKKRIVIYSPSQQRRFGPVRKEDNTISVSVLHILKTIGADNMKRLYPSGEFRRLRCDSDKRLVFLPPTKQNPNVVRVIVE